jgi:hypothetical protein
VAPRRDLRAIAHDVLVLAQAPVQLLKRRLDLLEDAPGNSSDQGAFPRLA